MLLQRLVEYAATVEEPVPPGFGVASVRYELQLSLDGTLLLN